eukprot:m.272029 g.272029  ORF g.272029 m.272029 type:complete len:608 (+) comp16106_c1_seq8:72-1895(+)
MRGSIGGGVGGFDCRLVRPRKALAVLVTCSAFSIILVGLWAPRLGNRKLHHLIENAQDCANRGGIRESYSVCEGVHYCCGVCTGVRECAAPEGSPLGDCACTLERDESGLLFRHQPHQPEARWIGNSTGDQTKPQITSNFECAVAGGDRYTYNYCGGIHYCCEACFGQFECQANGGWTLKDCACTEAVHLCGPGSTVHWISNTVWECSCGLGRVAWDSIVGNPNRSTSRNCLGLVSDRKDECCGIPRCELARVESLSTPTFVTTFRSDEAMGCTCRSEVEVRKLLQLPLPAREETPPWDIYLADVPTITGGEDASSLEELCRGHPAKEGELPHRVYYTAKRDPTMRTLTEGDHRWPDDYQFHYFNDIQLEVSMVRLSRLIANAGVLDLYKAYQAVRPWAFKADLWRLAILWACGGIYLDAKLRLIGNVSQIFPEARHQKRGGHPLLLVGDDIPQSFRVGAGYWNGLLAATPRHPELLEALRLGIRNIAQRMYFVFDKGGLNITGPGMLYTSINQHKGCTKCVQIVFELEETWPDDIKHNRLLQKGSKAPLCVVPVSWSLNSPKILLPLNTGFASTFPCTQVVKATTGVTTRDVASTVRPTTRVQHQN